MIQLVTIKGGKEGRRNREGRGEEGKQGGEEERGEKGGGNQHVSNRRGAPAIGFFYTRSSQSRVNLPLGVKKCCRRG